MACITCGLLLASGTSRAEVPFVHETVEATGDLGLYGSLAVDALGSPHISYYDETNDDLKYATKSGAVWTIETVDATGSVGSHLSLALNAQGAPSISYFDITNLDLKYASKSGGTWTIETVDASGTVGQYTSLALDHQGIPHISYQANGGLKYATKSDGVTWTTQAVRPFASGGFYTSLALDPGGNPRISHYEGPNPGRLQYASWNGEDWTIEYPSGSWPAGDPGYFTSLALDDQGNPHISYYTGLLKYASKSEGTWTVETVEETSNVGRYTSLVLDAQGIPHISYYDATNADLKYASKRGGLWITQTVDAPGAAGAYSSLALDAEGNPRIAHYDSESGDLKFSTGFAPGQVTSVPTEGASRAAVILAQNTPNPFNPRTTIRFTVPKTGAGSLTIYDVSGRWVATPLQGELTPGEHRVAWEGMDHAGRPLPSGVYLYRLELPGFDATRRMTLLR